MQSRTRAAFVERTEVVAFAIVKPDAVYFLTTRSHDPIVAPHVWTAAEFVEIVHQHWPALFERSRIQGEGEPLTDEVRTELRKNRTNATVRMADGTLYHPPGAGMLTLPRFHVQQ